MMCLLLAVSVMVSTLAQEDASSVDWMSFLVSFEILKVQQPLDLSKDSFSYCKDPLIWLL